MGDRHDMIAVLGNGIWMSNHESLQNANPKVKNPTSHDTYRSWAGGRDKLVSFHQQGAANLGFVRERIKTSLARLGYPLIGVQSVAESGHGTRGTRRGDVTCDSLCLMCNLDGYAYQGCE